MICVPPPGKHVSLVIWFPTWETHIPSDVCSLTWETHVTRDMCFLGRGTQIPSDMCSPTLTGSGQLSSLGTGLVETLGKIAFIREKKLSKYKFVSVKAYKNLESLTFD